MAYCQNPPSERRYVGARADENEALQDDVAATHDVERSVGANVVLYNGVSPSSFEVGSSPVFKPVTSREIVARLHFPYIGPQPSILPLMHRIELSYA
ncbi:MAG TPA: hypothetical protein VFE65_12540 [Pseudonocardia sp.]|jgi:hypothetical protein|nr:hypothetical protein [Pseudonocardia sp.]